MTLLYLGIEVNFWVKDKKDRITEEFGKGR